MRRGYLVATIIIAVAAAWGIFGGGFAGKGRDGDVLVVGTHPGYSPYESIDGQGQLVGFDIDVAEAIAERLGTKVAFVEGQFDSLILGLVRGRHDFVLSGMSITEDRLREIDMIPYHGEEVDEVALVFWEQVPGNATSLEAFAAGGRTVAVQQGTWQELFLGRVPGVAVRTLETNSDLILDVKHGKSAAVLFEKKVAYALQQQVPELRIVDLLLPEEFRVAGLGIGVSKDNAGLKRRIERAVDQLQHEGVLAAIEEKWFSGEGL